MRTEYIEIVFFLLENYSGMKIPKNTDIKNTFDCSFPTVKKAIDFLENRRYLINGVVEASIIERPH